ncbi:hypothetical protein KA107_02170 [Candidatus Pacearchaeota archaeon]|nr:hypothetical protein [Candidatus Pacearchaeota archaeon]
MAVISIETPYHNFDERIRQENICYAILCCKHAIREFNEVPYASHLLFTQVVLNGRHFYVPDNFEDKFGLGRERAIIMTDEIRKRVDKLVFYTDRGFSNGMRHAKELAIREKIPFEERKLPLVYLEEVLRKND